nr:MAG TPA: hypothetical protein [Caudoviricetes sp.]
MQKSIFLLQFCKKTYKILLGDEICYIFTTI